jgi:hypothetical protein
MVKVKKKITYNSKSREDLSNPNNKVTHTALLKKANIKQFNGDYFVIKQNNGRIIVKGKQ